MPTFGNIKVEPKRFAACQRKERMHQSVDPPLPARQNVTSTNNRHYVIPGLRNRFEAAILPRLLPRAAVARLVGVLSCRLYA